MGTVGRVIAASSLCFAVLGALLTGCKERGTTTLLLESDGGCPQARNAAQVQSYLIAGASCGSCKCGECLRACLPSNCTPACENGLCSASVLENGGLNLDPPGPGSYAAVVQMIATDDGGISHVVGSACADLVANADGTESIEKAASLICCGK